MVNRTRGVSTLAGIAVALVAIALVAPRLSAQNQATGVTFRITVKEPAPTPNPAVIQESVRVNLRVELYKPNDQNEEVVPLNIRQQRYTLTAEKATALIIDQAAPEFEIAANRRSAVKQINGGNAGNSFDVTTDVRWTEPGDQVLILRGAVQFTDGSVKDTSVSVRIKVVAARVELVSIDFRGDSLHRMRKTGEESWDPTADTFASNGDTVIGAGGCYWRVQPPLNDPVCYTAGTRGKVAAKIKITAPRPVDVALVANKLDRPASIVTSTKIQKILQKGAGEYEIEFPMVEAFPDTIAYKFLFLEWRYGVNQDNPDTDLGVSQHIVILTLGAPTGSVVTANRIAWAANVGNDKKSLKSNALPLAMREGVQREAGPEHFAGGDALSNTWSLFDPGIKGPCVTYSDLMRRSLLILGVPEDKVKTENVTSHPIPTAAWLGEAVDFTVLRWFSIWGGGDWVNEGVCGVDTEDKGWIYYDVAGGDTFGPRKAHDEGEQFEEAPRPPGLVENQWREPGPVPKGGPIMAAWVVAPLYSNGIDFPLRNFAKVKAPNGGETIKIGTKRKIEFYTAGLQGLKVNVYVRLQGGADTLLGQVDVPAAGAEAGNFSKLTEIEWNTTGYPAGQYGVFVGLTTATTDSYRDWSDGWITLAP